MSEVTHVEGHGVPFRLAECSVHHRNDPTVAKLFECPAIFNEHIRVWCRPLTVQTFSYEREIGNEYRRLINFLKYGIDDRR